MNQTRKTKPKILAFLKEECGWSRGIRSVLNKYALNFEEKQVHIPENYQEMVMKSGQHLQPTLVLDGIVLPDISGVELENYLFSNKFIQEKIEQTDGIIIDSSCTPEEEALKTSDSVSVTMTKASLGSLGGVRNG